MTHPIPRGLKPVYSASPTKAPVRLTQPEMRDLVIARSDLPRGFGSQFAGWQGGVR